MIWRSLRDAPPLEDLLTTLICFLAQAQHQEHDNPLPGTISCYRTNRGTEIYPCSFGGDRQLEVLHNTLQR